MRTKRTTPAALVTAVLEGYASRGVFRGFSASAPKFQMVWHYDRRFELHLDVRRKTLSFPSLLPGIPANSPMFRDLRAFVESRHDDDLPVHRRVDPERSLLSTTTRGGNFALTITVKDRDFEYATRKLIHVVHEIFLTFLLDGPYYEYLVEHLGLEPDKY